MTTAYLTHITKKAQQGFTLIELLIVIGILAILMGIVLIAINPARQFAQANNTSRQNGVTQILNSIGQYMSDNHGALPPGISSNPEISSTGSNICAQLVPTYIAALPVDPSVNGGTNITNCGGAYDTGYTISTSSANRVTISAPNAELSQTISVTR